MRLMNSVSMMMIVLVLATGFDVRQAAKAGGTTNVLAIDTSTFDVQVLGALSGVVYTEVSPAAFLTMNLSPYSVLYVGSTFQHGDVVIPSQAALDALNSRKGDLAAFLQSGHGIVALTEPIGTGRYLWLPVSVDAFYGYHWGVDDVHIVNPSHPVMAGLTDAGLSYWGASVHTYFTDVGPLTTLSARLSDEPVTLAGTYGAGRLVLTGQDPDYHYRYDSRGKQQVQFVQNAIDWAAGSAVIPAPGALVLAFIGAGAAGWLRRCRAL